VQMPNTMIVAIAAAALATSTAAMATHSNSDHHGHQHMSRGHFGDRRLVGFAPSYIGLPPPRLVGPATYTFHPERANPFGPSFFLYQGPACNYIWPYTAWPDKTCIPSNGFHWE
jgi:hypothetical protein